MACCCQAASHYLGQFGSRSMTAASHYLGQFGSRSMSPYSVTMPQWDKQSSKPMLYKAKIPEIVWIERQMFSWKILNYTCNLLNKILKHSIIHINNSKVNNKKAINIDIYWNKIPNKSWECSEVDPWMQGHLPYQGSLVLHSQSP